MLDFFVDIDFGASDTKFLLLRSGASAVCHFVPASCVLISKDDYEFEAKIKNLRWGTGVVRVPVSGKPDQYYRVGLDTVERTFDGVKKPEAIVPKLICLMGWLDRSASDELRGKCRILLPLSEFSFRGPMAQAIAWALKNQPEVNGEIIRHVKIEKFECEPEGSGLIIGDRRLTAAVICGHRDLSLVLGVNGKCDRTQSHTITRGGAIGPLRYSELPVFGDEVAAAIAFGNQNWGYFAQDGLTESDVSAMATVGLEEYGRRIGKAIIGLANVCREFGVSEIRLGGGSCAQVHDLFLDSGLKILSTNKQEQVIKNLFQIKSKPNCRRLVDLFLLWSSQGDVASYLESANDTPTVPFANNQNDYNTEILLEESTYA